MMQPASKSVLIVLPDNHADRETPLISGFGGDFYGLRVSHAPPGGGARSTGGPHVTDLAGDADASDYRDQPRAVADKGIITAAGTSRVSFAAGGQRPPGVLADAPLASAAHPI
ncbi:hypothetical protein [Paracoccus marinaquae]|uniref:Uncharacterized protein n=1 Tax=Paracoccus marinaquae TaxID=2841926 RepID=A0ABS6AFY3_9RHOB|nr:hypothetical protein [Paracoccus marinaquae]MBU3029503.1 hypothetical protein [Paracoccus marinaquae]